MMNFFKNPFRPFRHFAHTPVIKKPAKSGEMNRKKANRSYKSIFLNKSKRTVLFFRIGKKNLFEVSKFRVAISSLKDSKMMAIFRDHFLNSRTRVQISHKYGQI
jgi:hypothetical protein